MRRLNFDNCLSCVYNCDDQSVHVYISFYAAQIYYLSYLHLYSFAFSKNCLAISVLVLFSIVSVNATQCNQKSC